MKTLKRATPESLGIPSESFLKLYEELERNKLPLHSFVLMRYGKVASMGGWHPYTTQMNHITYSTSKSITSIAVGLCIEEGYFSLDDKLLDFFPELITGPPHEWNKQRTVRHLLTMTAGETGNANSIDRSYPDWFKTYLNTPPRIKPGTLFGYDNSATHALSALIQKVTGLKLFDYLKPRLFDPLGIESAYWEEQMGVNTASRGFHCSIVDLVKIAQLLLQKGKWLDKQLIPEKWVEESTSKHVEVTNFGNIDGNPGYGYQFWMYRDGAFGTKGLGGQNFIVFPKYDIVWAFNANLLDKHGGAAEFMHMAWPILFDKISDESLPDNPKMYEKLLAVEDNLEIQLPENTNKRSLMENKLNGKKYIIASNNLQFHELRVDKTENGLYFTFILGDPLQTWEFEALFNDWKEQHISITNDEGWIRYVWRNETILECVILLKENLGTYRIIIFVGEDNSISIEMYSMCWRDVKRLEMYEMGYHW